MCIDDSPTLQVYSQTTTTTVPILHTVTEGIMAAEIVKTEGVRISEAVQLAVCISAWKKQVIRDQFQP